MALSEILHVNSVVWEVHQGYAQAVFRHLPQQPVPVTNTVHLHYASRRHYEYTDIPKVLYKYYYIFHTIPIHNLDFFSRILFLLKYFLMIIDAPLANDVPVRFHLNGT